MSEIASLSMDLSPINMHPKDSFKVTDLLIFSLLLLGDLMNLKEYNSEV